MLLLTFAQSPTAFHTLALGYGVVNWVTHGVFVGEHHVYASPQIDDFYLASKIYTGRDVPHHRRRPAGVHRLAERRAGPIR